MRRNRNKIIVVLLILLISIGFAFLSSNLSIIGNTLVSSCYCQYDCCGVRPVIEISKQYL